MTQLRTCDCMKIFEVNETFFLHVSVKLNLGWSVKPYDIVEVKNAYIRIICCMTEYGVVVKALRY
jgi:hypothetical protein